MALVEVIAKLVNEALEIGDRQRAYSFFFREQKLPQVVLSPLEVVH